jgi:hypothetical protein
MNLTIPSVDLSSAKSELAELGPRARSAIADLELPKVNLGRAQVPDIDHAAKTVSGSVSDAGQAVTGVLSDAGQAMTGALTDAGQMVAGALSAAGDRLKDLQPNAEPKRRSIAPLAIGGVLVGAVVVGIGTAAAFLMDPIQGARRRAAIRHRLEAAAERLRQARGIEVPTPLLEAPRSEAVSVPIEMGPGGTSDLGTNLEYADDSVPVSTGTGARHNGAARSADSTVVEAAGE